MKKLTLSALLLAAIVLSSTAQAQVINGDLNHNQGLDVEDVTLLIDGYLTGEAEWFTPKIDFYQEDNSLIYGKWWKTNDEFVWYQENGTINGMSSLTYKFFPSQGRILMYEDGTLFTSVDVVYLTDEVMIRRYSDGTHETLTRTQPKFYEAVDLGLSVKWATMNVGANAPEEYGDYFAWGETEPKDYYDWSTYKWCNGSVTTMTKYCTKSYWGTVDNKTVLELSDDAARANWGGTWRMPTIDEIKELLDNCHWEWTTRNDVNGFKVTGPNGASVFLPAAGYRGYDYLNGAGNSGCYWSSSLDPDSDHGAYYLYFNSGSADWDYGGRYYGISVRAVCP